MRIIILTAIALSVAAAQPVHAQGCDEKQNFMIMPNGQCLVLNYLGTLAESRSLGTQVNASYQKQFDANLVLETNTYNLVTETKESRDSRLNDLAIAAQSRAKVNTTVQSVEDMLYPLHLRALGLVRAGFRR